ncbi:response regulator [Candidatus Accumulibacter sp. ACC003]|uniref:response regulator transcription factor n=1 Tax=Candidatus Accumulibacter sp. ACC003 TaxID=2823334 RepID=UPI0025C1A450|nr:response regulator [Candidatus Accumulibacter sp. ACC003]
MESRESEPTVFVVDDDAAVCDAIAMLLRAAGMRVETFRSALTFLKAHRAGRSGCLVLDIRMPGMSGPELQDELHKRRQQIPIVFLTGHGDVPLAVRALKKGAVDFIEKPPEEERLVLAVLNALHVDRERRQAANRYDHTPPDVTARLRTLSEREREVLHQVLDSKPTRQIAEQLRISVKTVEFHRARIREKMGVARLAQLFSLLLPAGDKD